MGFSNCRTKGARADRLHSSVSAPALIAALAAGALGWGAAAHAAGLEGDERTAATACMQDRAGTGACEDTINSGEASVEPAFRLAGLSGGGSVPYAEDGDWGGDPSASGTYAMSLGRGAEADGLHATAAGALSRATANQTTVFGYNSLADWSRASAFGAGAQGENSGATALGALSRASAHYSVALGAESVATEMRTVSVGDAGEGFYRRIVNVEDGIGDRDAVTVRQLNAALDGVGGGGSGLDGLPIGHNPGIYTDAPLVTGADAIAFGGEAVSTGISSIALGRQSEATGRGALALGVTATSIGMDSIAIGMRADASTDTSTVVGSYSRALGDEGTALGARSSADGRWSTAISGGWATGENAIAIGRGAYAHADYTTAAGAYTEASGEHSLAMGYESAAMGARSVALGTGFDWFGASLRESGAMADGSVAIGYAALSDADGAVALGQGSFADEAGTVSVGSHDDTGRYGAFTRRIVNVSEGVVSADSSDAVTGAQLFATHEAIDANTAGIGALDLRVGETETALAGFTTGLDGLDTRFTADISALDGRVSVNESGIAALESRIASGGLGLVIQDADTLALSVGGATGGGLVSVAGTDGARTLGGVADGAISADSDEAVTGSQLFAARQAIDANTAQTDALEGRVGVAETGLVDLTDGLGALDTRFTADISDLDGRVSVNESGIAALESRISEGGLGVVLQDADTLALTVAGATGGDVVSFAGSDGARRLSGLAEGAVSAGSDEAVTGAQLFATHARMDTGSAQMAAMIGGGAQYNPATGSFINPSFTILGSDYSTVGDALGALNVQVGENTAGIAGLIETGTGGGAGGQAELDALRAEMEAMRAVMNAQSEALNMAMGQLDQLSQGNATGGSASGEGSTAVGEGARAEQYGDTAFGQGAAATGDPSTAIGYQALASGQHSTAIGGNTEATGDLSTALGQGAIASGANSLALGQAALASHDNAIAIGQGVATSRDNQIALGGREHTYTLAGISSAASRDAQSGRTYMVTADQAGNLATMDMDPWFNRIEGLEDATRRTSDSLRTHADGVAMALALGGAQVIQPGQTFSVSGNIGHFDGATAGGFGAIGRLDHNVFVNVGVGTGFRTGTVGGRAGVSWGW